MATKKTNLRVNEVCRLCLAEKNLVSVFEKRFGAMMNMREVVLIATGVEILAKDMISQKICEKCHQISFKMYQFRQQSLKNDKYLKDQYKELLEKNKDMKVSSENQLKKLPVKEEPKKEIAAKPAYKIHPSITKLFKEYPQIKLPTVCLQKHIAPVVSMEMDAVENYFKKNSLDFQKYTQHALKWDKKIAMKKTSTKTSLITAPEEIKSNEMINKSKSSNQSDPLQMSSKPLASTSRASTVSEKEKIHPFAIKRNQDKDKSSYKIVNVSKIIEKKSDDADDNTKPSTSKKRKHGKRTLSDSDLFSEPEAKKSSIIESVGLTPKKTSSESGTLYVEKSVALFICSICNSVQYSEKGLKKHQEKHLKCQFCKAKFKTMDLKTNHIQSLCVIKNMMNNLPLIQLEKVEKNVTIREAYRTAFKDFPRIAEVECLKVTETPRDDKKTDASTKQSDIIEILSDDECDVKEEMPRSAVIPESVNVTSTSNPIPVTATTTSTSVPSSSSSSAAPNVSLSTIQEMSISSSVVKPDIKIKNNNLLEIIDPKVGDIRVVKELIVRYNNIKLEADSSTQTELPSSDSIKVHQGDLTTELKYLKHLLYVFKVPVEIKEGSFNVEYSYQKVQMRQKKLDMWNDLITVDVKYPNKTSAANSPASAPVDIPQPNFRIVSAVRNNHSSEIESHIGNSSSTSTSTFPLPAPNNSVIVSPVYGVRDNIAPIIPQLSNLEVPQIPQNVQETSNIDVPRSLPNPIVSSSEASSPSLSMNPTNSYPLHNSTLNNSGAGDIQMRLLDDVGSSTAPNSVASTVPSETVSVPLAGTIRVKNVWELI